MGARPQPASTADKWPGAGAAAFPRTPPPAAASSSTSSASSSNPEALAPSSSFPPPSATSIEDWRRICLQLTRPPVEDVVSADELLEQGISDYTVSQGVDLLGKGKFSVVYRAIKNGQEYAIKHTPLHPHHPLIATRLIREPELLSQLAPHPNLIRVFETIRTEGHFYLVEEYLPNYISLDALCARYPNQRLPFPFVLKILQQLVSVVRDGLHQYCVCHRDIKPENVLVDPESGHITLIDMGLATHFSLSSPKLSTCCGSPAFHCPEIVLSLSRPAGEVSYWGSEVDVWCVALTVLRCWTGRRYPIGTGHKSLSVMRGRAEDLLGLVAREVMSFEDDEQRDKERDLRETLRSFLDMDGRRRIDAFGAFDVGDEVRQSTETFQRAREFKQTTFSLSALKYTLPLQIVTEPLQPPCPTLASPVLDLTSVPNSPSPAVLEPPASSTIVLRNPTDQHPVKVVSFLKYALRCANILYHCRSTETQALSAPGTPVHSLMQYFPPPTSSGLTPMTGMPPVPDLLPSTAPPESMTIFQCVATLPALPLPPPPALEPLAKERRPFLPSLFRSSSSNSSVRSASTPPVRSNPDDQRTEQRRSASGSRKKDGKETTRCVVFLFALRFSSPSAAAVAEERRQRRQRSVSRRGGSRSRASSRFPPSAGSTSVGQDLIVDGLTSRLNEAIAEGSRRPAHSRQTSYGGLSTLNPESTRTGESGMLTPTTFSRHPSIRRERSASGSGSGSASSNSTPPMSPAMESLKQLAMEPTNSNKRGSTVRPSSRIRSISTAGARAASLSRSSASSSYGHQHIPLHHPQGHLAEPVVLVHVSDPLALPALRSALTIVPQTPSTAASSPLVSPTHMPTPPASYTASDSPSAIAIPLNVPLRRHAPLQASLNEEDEEPRRGRSEARSADSYSSSHSGSGGKLASAKVMGKRPLKPSTPMPSIRSDSTDDRTPTATPAPTDRQRQTPTLCSPAADRFEVVGERLGSVSSEDSNDGPLSPPPIIVQGTGDATRIVDARKNSSASSIGEIFEGLGLRGVSPANGERRGKSPAVKGWGWGETRNPLERSRSVGLWDR